MHAPSVDSSPSPTARPSSSQQLDLFDSVLEVYAKAGDAALTNDELYRRVGEHAGVDPAAWGQRAPVGRGAQPHNLLKRQVRWHQQTLRAMGLLQRMPDERGLWQLTPKGHRKLAQQLTPAPARRSLVAFSTDLGVALWSDANSFFPRLDEPIHLVMSSLPYPLRKPRAYGGPSEAEYVDWTCRMLEPLVAQLAPGANVALNVGNDIFLEGSPARSLYVQRLTLALADRFDLELMDTLIWENPTRPPGPIRWASMSRQQLNGTYEPIIWMTNDPARCVANNRRVLQPHSDKHRRLMAAGGEARSTSYGDGSHRVRPGSYSTTTEGRIPRNVLRVSHNCAHKRDLTRLARASGLPVHGATMPLALAQMLIEFLSEPDQLVVDPTAGWLTGPFACENTSRRWLATEQMREYLLVPAMRMRERSGFEARCADMAA